MNVSVLSIDTGLGSHLNILQLWVGNSEDGGELYVFDAVGRHLRTVDALTGHVLYQFGYNAAGLLVTMTDLENDVTSIERDANGNATAIVGPFGARTTLGTRDANGYLTSIANPAGKPCN